ncbi:hypothetical protein PV10_00667 [Exophiala mesophila]|uniref:DNA replication checkpoint mediator MRC1 domain-containing protein n=1 Tax=Exophiala mesophila TaxID=212818 RepID=A0A0D1Y7W6_EXOME|nr:uncharacterized protein PV10_00667 [Exophiala mesophila]KIV96851.1 hypothetical protein PV10_00667 [Exophiala mesophila]
MSSPAASPSPSASPTLPDSSALTPSRKVQALLARFDDTDSDADSTLEQPANRQSPNRVSRIPAAARPLSTKASEPPSNEDELDDDDILPFAPRSRLAARLQGLNPNHDDASDESEDPPSQIQSDSVAPNMSNTEDIPTKPRLRRRLLTKRRSSPVHTEVDGDRRMSPSSLFSSPPAKSQDLVRPGPQESESEAEQPSTSKGNSKFLALVAKHRKQRMEKEQEESAKKAARAEELKHREEEIIRQRGSSPADDTGEDSDVSGNEAAKKLSTQSRPARKASKKAIEEINRETQRMSRNMQLAHQAKVKKRITKESLLARFNFSSSTTTEHSAALPSSSRSNSRAGSDNEANIPVDTPPTSPLRDETTPHKDHKVAEIDTTTEIQQIDSAVTLNKGKGRAHPDEPNIPIAVLLATESLNQVQPQNLPEATVPVTKTRLLGSARHRSLPSDESDSELEVITSRGDQRKFAAFERLPKRKAKETQSHLALRSLAHLVGGEDRKSTMNAAELEMTLRKAARLQAKSERDEKIAELRARGIMVQTTEDREREQQDVEDLLEKARQEAAEIQKREKAAAKKEGNYVNDGLDDEDESEDEDFQDDDNVGISDDSEDDEDDEEASEDENSGSPNAVDALVDDQASEIDSDESSMTGDESEHAADHSEAEMELDTNVRQTVSRRARTNRVLSDDDEDDIPAEKDGNDKVQSLGRTGSPKSPALPTTTKTPQSILQSHRKQIPGLQMSDDFPIGLTQAFAATMADPDSQVDAEEQDSLEMTMDLPSPNIPMAPRLARLESMDIITDSQPASQTQPLNVSLSFSQSFPIPQSPAIGPGITSTQATPSQRHFEATQDGDYMLSPFMGDRFGTETPQQPQPHSTIETEALPEGINESPILQRRSRLRRGRLQTESDEDEAAKQDESAFEIMRRAAKKPSEAFDKSRSHARNVVDEAAEESEDEYAGLGGASDDDIDEEENEQDREMIDENTQIGQGDEAKHAKFFADREREQDQAAVSKLMKDITTGALRRKRGNDDLDLSDEEDAAVRRREAKRREFAKMRQALLKDEAVGKIAEDKKKEAFLRSIEDREEFSDDDVGGFNDGAEPEEESQAEEPEIQSMEPEPEADTGKEKPTLAQGPTTQPLIAAPASKMNQMRRGTGRVANPASVRPLTLAEIRESVSFLVEEPDSQAAMIDLGLSDSEDESEAYVNLDRHFKRAEADENAEDGDDLGDFIVDDLDQSRDEAAFKKPEAPYSETRAPYSERRTNRPNVINRLNMLRQSSSSSSSSGSRMAFYSSSTSANGSLSNVPSLLRRATTNSSRGSISGRNETVSATGVVTNKLERGSASAEKEFIRKGNGGSRNAVNYRPTIREEKMQQRAGVIKKKTAAKAKKSQGGFLGGLFGNDSWT